jgi:hypothetical protein
MSRTRLASILRRLAVVSALIATTACGSDSPTAPSAGPLTGTWVSTDRRIRWELVQSGSTVTGTEFDVDRGARTEITGSVEGEQFTYTVVTRVTDWQPTPDAPPTRVSWGYSLFADVTGDRMEGHISNFGVPGGYPRAWYYLTIVRVPGSAR